MADQTTPVSNFTDPLLDRFFLSPEEKANKEKGKQIIKAFYNQQTNSAPATSTNLNYFQARKAKQEMLLLWAKGSQSMQEFLDYMNVSDGNKAWVNMDMTPQRIAAQFVGTLVESMAKNKTYACVNAIDDGSLTEKENRLFESLFRMHEAETIAAAQEVSGIQLEPPNVYVPDDEMSARVHFELEDRLPKEIRFEEMLAMIQDNIKFERLLNRKTLYDMTVLNTGATKIEKLGPKQYTVRKCIANNVIYNFFMNDTGELEVTMIGEFYNLKVKDFREKFGKTATRPDGLSENEIFEVAKMSTNKNVGTFNYNWDSSYALTTYSGNRPYDDSSILVLDCEINCGTESYFVSKKDAFGRENIQSKKTTPYRLKTKDGKIIEQEKPENVEILKKKKNQWMHGIYAPYGDKLLFWGEADLIINEFTNTSKPLSSYTINIPNNDGNYVPSLFERIMEPLREYSLVKLRRKQMIAKMPMTGYKVDVENARNVDLGNGDTIGWEEIVRIKDQTGVEVWSSKGLDPLQKESPPFSPSTPDDSIQKIIGLTTILAGIVQEIRGLIGVPQYRDGSDVGERTSGVLQEQQESASYNVTDYVLNANNQLWEETFYKICLLNWNDIVKEEPESSDDLLNTRFKVQVKMRSTEYERAQLEKDIDRYSQVPDAQGNPSLTLKDAMMIREIDDPKLARWYLSKTYEENRRKASEEARAREESNAKAQQESLLIKAKEDARIEKDKIASQRELEVFKSTQAKELSLLNGFMAAIGKGIIPPDIIMPAIQQLVPNIAIPLSMENKQLAKTQETNDMAEEQKSQEMPEGEMQGQEQGMEQPMEEEQMMEQQQMQPM